MTARLEKFGNEVKKLPRSLKEWEAFHDLKKKVEDFTEILPLLRELSKDSIKPRHWVLVNKATNTELKYDNDLFSLAEVLEANILASKEEIEDICDGADKQLKIESNLKEIHE